jgi:hypothetical protein
MSMRRLITGLIVTGLLAVPVPYAFADEHEAPELNHQALTKIALLADFIVEAAADPDADPDPDADDAALAAATTSVTDLRTLDIGWGALFKILKLAAATGEDPETLVGEIGPDGEFDFGALRNSLEPEQRAIYDSLAKNFGTLVSGDRKAAHAEAKAEAKAERDARKAEKRAERDARKAARGQSGGG